MIKMLLLMYPELDPPVPESSSLGGLRSPGPATSDSLATAQGEEGPDTEDYVRTVIVPLILDVISVKQSDSHDRHFAHTRHINK